MQSSNSTENPQPCQGPDAVAPASDFITWRADAAVKLRKASRDDLDSIPPTSVVSVFEKVVREHPDAIAMIDTSNEIHDIYTYKEYYDLVIRVAKVFIELGLEMHHGVGLLGYNSPQWFISHLACVYAGGLSSGIYATNSPETCWFIADNSECNIMVVENDAQLQKILKVWPRLPQLKAIIQYRGDLKEKRDGLYTWEDILKMDADDSAGELEKRLKTLAPNKCCALIYTSGTTGDPKGAMISHDNIVWTLKTLLDYVNEDKTYAPDTVVSYLPLNHIAALMVDVYWPLATGGGTVYFSRPDALKGTLVKTLREARPTFFFGVPRVWEKFMESLIEAMKNSNNQKNAKAGEYGNQAPPDIRSILGLDRCRFTIIGAAPCKLEVMQFFLSCGIQLMEIYGMSESTGPHNLNVHSSNKIGSVGRTVPGMKTKLEATTDGELEICMDGRHVFMGYLNDEARTREAFDDDMWLHTGDVGYEDEDGFLTVVARIKELIITAGGENIAPVPIESRVLKELPCLSHCMLVGERQKFLAMLLAFKIEMDTTTGLSKDVLDRKSLEWTSTIGSKSTTISEIVNKQDPLVNEAIQKGIDRANEGAISRAQRIQKWTILPRDFSIAGGELGPTMKMRRNEICKIYKKEIDELYRNE